MPGERYIPPLPSGPATVPVQLIKRSPHTLYTVLSYRRNLSTRRVVIKHVPESTHRNRKPTPGRHLELSYSLCQSRFYCIAKFGEDISNLGQASGSGRFSSRAVLTLTSDS